MRPKMGRVSNPHPYQSKEFRETNDWSHTEMAGSVSIPAWYVLERNSITVEKMSKSFDSCFPDVEVDPVIRPELGAS